MSTGHAIGDRSSTTAVENENTLIVDYWLEFLAATEEREEAQNRSLRDNHLESTFERFARRAKTLSDNQARRSPAPQDAFPLPPAGSDTTLNESRSGEWSGIMRECDEPGILARGKLRLANRLRRSGLFDLFSRRT